MNELHEEWKIREFVEAFGRKEVDILGTCQTNMEGCYALDYCYDHENG